MHIDVFPEATSPWDVSVPFLYPWRSRWYIDLASSRTIRSPIDDYAKGNIDHQALKKNKYHGLDTSNTTPIKYDSTYNKSY